MAQEFSSFSLSIIIIALYAAAHLFVDKCDFCIFVASCVCVCTHSVNNMIFGVCCFLSFLQPVIENGGDSI